MTQSIRQLLIIALCILSANVSAKVLSGVTIPDAYQPATGPALTLQGASIRSKFVMDIYAASFYSQTNMSTAEEALAADELKAMRLNMIYPKLASKKFRDAWVSSIKANNSKTTVQAHETAIYQFVGLFNQDLKKGDDIILESSSSGVRVILNQKLLAEIEDPELFNLLLSTWLGPKPPSNAFKQQILTNS